MRRADSRNASDPNRPIAHASRRAIGLAAALAAISCTGPVAPPPVSALDSSSITAQDELLGPAASPHGKSRTPSLKRPPTPLYPPDGATISATDRPVAIALSWRARGIPIGTQFFVEVFDEGAAPRREVFSKYVRRPNADVVLPAKSTSYSWRIYAVSAPARAYASSARRRFSIHVDEAKREASTRDRSDAAATQ